MVCRVAWHKPIPFLLNSTNQFPKFLPCRKNSRMYFCFLKKKKNIFLADKFALVCRLSQGPSKRNYVFCVRIKLIRRHSLLLDDVLLPAPICQCRRSFYLCFRSIIPFLYQLLFLHRPGSLSIMLIYANETPHWKNCMIYIYFFHNLP